ncbi:MAG TPA: EVE domain-containing protein [Anaerovoracaceae bacterium]|nr:EVE domain-containing protein [Anaerovoracaceae bacterium]
MPAHIFVLGESNYSVCIQRGLVGLPEGRADSKNEKAVNDALLSRAAIIKDGDYILFYVAGSKELRGIWKASGEPFYDETPVWEDKIYPFRFRLSSTEFSFDNPLRLHDIYDLQNMGKIWTFALNRASGSNAMFSISNTEFQILLQEYLKINPFTLKKNIIMEPYPVKSANLFEYIHKADTGAPRYEASLMALLLHDFVHGKHQDVFGDYSDYLSYVPTNLGTEMDILLMFGNPENSLQTMSYDVIEVKLDRFDGKALHQLIGYESWFIQKKVQGDINMVRTTAIANRFDTDVIDYVQKREKFEDKKPDYPFEAGREKPD